MLPRVRGQPLAQRRWVSSTGAPASSSMKARRSGRIAGIERQIGAAGLENAEQRDHHLERALDAQSDHHLGADAEALQMMRQLIGAGIELAHRSALCSSNTTATASGFGPTCAANSSGKVADGIGCAVSFHSRRMVWRSAGDRMSRLPIGCSGSATAASSSRTSRSASASTLARSNRSVAYSSTPSMPGRRAVGARAARQG